MTRRLRSIAPVQAGKVLGVLYGGVGLIFVPFFVIAGIAGAFAGQGQETSSAAGAFAAGMMLFMAILFPVIYAVFGFIGGVVGAWLYNLIARWVGGIEFEVDDVPAASPPSPTITS